MKVNGFQVEEHGAGYALTIRLHVGKDELADDWVGNLIARVQAGGDLFGDAEQPETIEASQPETSETTGRRRRASRDTKAADAGMKAEDPTPAVAGRRRRRAPAATEPPKSAGKSASSPSDAKIADEDLSKAASEAARRMKSPAKVMALLADMGVAKVNELEGRNRGEFLERAKGLK